MNWDVFISHASEDKETVARPLAVALTDMGIRVWLDDYELTIGDSLRRSIDRGLSSSRFGVVVLSQSFFAKEWPNKELDGLAAREDGLKKILLPVWHKVSRDDICRFSPLLADRLAVSTDGGISAVALRVSQAIDRDRSGDPPTDQIHVRASAAVSADQSIRPDVLREHRLDRFSTDISALATLGACVIVIALAVYAFRGLGFVSAVTSLSLCALMYFLSVRNQPNSIKRIGIGLICWVGAALVFWGLISLAR